MAVFTTFLTGAVIGGGLKWAYDQWQDPNTSVLAEVKSAASQTAGQVTKAVNRADEKVEAVAEDVKDN